MDPTTRARLVAHLAIARFVCEERVHVACEVLAIVCGPEEAEAIHREVALWQEQPRWCV